MVSIEKLKVVELFAGVGAWSKALENLNIDYEVVLAVENDEYPMTAYNAIHNANFNTTDITEINESEIPDCDLICYSPPCQSWSAAGKQIGYEDQRGILFFDALRIIKEKKPKYAIMENVKNLTQKKFKKEFEGMLELLEEAGYKNQWKILNAKDFNIPQNRERVFVVSVRDDINERFNFPEVNKLQSKLNDLLEEDANMPLLHNIYGGFKETKARVFEDYSPTIRTSAGGGHIPSVVMKNVIGNGDAFSGKVVKAYLESDQIEKVNKKGFKVVHKANDGFRLVKDNGDIKDEEEYSFIREITTQEAFKLMGFEAEDYEKARKAVNAKFYKGKDKSNTRMYRMAGNSIVVDVCKAIFKELLIK